MKKISAPLNHRPFPAAFLLPLAPILLALFGCAKEQPAPEIPPRPVQAAAAVTRDVPIYLENFGNLVSPRSVDIVSQVTGKILEVHFEEGTEIEKGDLLFTIDPREYRAALDRARASLASAEADLKLKRQTLERNRPLLARELISRQEFDILQTQVEAAEAQVALNRALVEQAEVDLGYCTIAAPSAGVAGKRLIDPGNVVTANSGTLVRIRSIDPLYADFTLPEIRVPEVRKWMAEGSLRVEVTPPGDPAAPYPGELKLIDNLVDEATGTIALRALVPNPERRLWPGQYVTVRLILYTQTDAVLVPASAVQLGQKGLYLFVVAEDNTAELRDEIEVGLMEEEYLVINEGVEEGELVVTFGQLGLSPGVRVQILDPEDRPVTPRTAPPRRHPPHLERTGRVDRLSPDIPVDFNPQTR